MFMEFLLPTEFWYLNVAWIFFWSSLAAVIVFLIIDTIEKHFKKRAKSRRERDALLSEVESMRKTLAALTRDVAKEKDYNNNERALAREAFNALAKKIMRMNDRFSVIGEREADFSEAIVRLYEQIKPKKEWDEKKMRKYNVIFRQDAKAPEYFYFAYEEYQPGEMVVVDTSRGPAIAYIVAPTDTVPNIAPDRFRSIIGRVDMEIWKEKERERLAR